MTTLISFAQVHELSQDSVINRLELNTLNLRVQSGAAVATDYYNRGNLLAFFGDTVNALADFDLAISKDQELELAYVGRGTIYQKQGKYELSEKDLNAAIKLNKTSTVALNNRGYLYQQWNKPDLAIKDFESTIKIDSKFERGYMNLADVYFSQDKNDQAFVVLDQMVAARKDDPKVYSTRSEIYRDAGMLRKALDDLNKAVELSGFDDEYLIERAKFKDDYISDDVGAWEDCDLAILKNPNVADYYYQRSRPLYDLEEFEAVIENCDKAIVRDPKHANALIMKANVTDMFGFYEDAKKLYDRAILADPNQYDGYIQLAISEFGQGKKQQSLATLERYIARGTFNKNVIEYHGKIAADLKQFDVALKDFSELITRNPENAANYFLRGMVQDSLGNTEAACNDMVKADQLGLNEAHQYLRKHCKSRLSAKTLLIEDQLDAALQLEREGKTQEAILAYTDLIKIAPDSSVFYYNRGKAKRRLNYHTGAIDDYLKAIQIDGDRVVYIVSLAVSYSYLDKIDEAIAQYKQAIKIEPSYAMSYYNLGGIYAQQKKYDDAIELLETSLYYSPNYTKAMMALGDCYLDLSEMDKACEWFKRAEKAGDSSAFGKRVRTCK